MCIYVYTYIYIFIFHMYVYITSLVPRLVLVYSDWRSDWRSQCEYNFYPLIRHLFESQTYGFVWRMVVRRKIMCPLIRGVCFLECRSLEILPYSSVLTSRPMFGQPSVHFFQNEKSRTICHIRGQTCLLTTRSLTQFFYIHKITNSCFPYFSDRRSRKSWELVAPSSQQSSNIALAIKKFLRYKEKRLSLCLNKCIICFFLELRTACQVISPGLLPFR